jgi:hypothetical protein
VNSLPVKNCVAPVCFGFGIGYLCYKVGTFNVGAVSLCRCDFVFLSESEGRAWTGRHSLPSCGGDVLPFRLQAESGRAGCGAIEQLLSV